MKKPVPTKPTDVISEDEWSKIIKACEQNKWFCIIERIRQEEDHTVPMHTLNSLCFAIRGEGIRAKSIYPANLGRLNLNRTLWEAGLKFRLIRVKYERGKPYEGSLQLKRSTEVPRCKDFKELKELCSTA